MRVVACVALFLILLPVLARAQSPVDELRLRNQILATHISGMLDETGGMLDRAVDVVISKKGRERIVNGSLSSLVKKVDGVRAVIVTDGSGDLIYDSSQKTVKRQNLSSREYFKKTVFSKNDEVVISSAVIGKQSGIPFIPVSKRIVDPMKKAEGVAIAITTPQGWLNGANCYDCVITVFNSDGDLLVSNPPGTEGIEDLFQKVRNEESEGMFRGRVGIYPTVSAWQIIPNYENLTVISTVRLPN